MNITAVLEDLCQKAESEPWLYIGVPIVVLAIFLTLCFCCAYFKFISESNRHIEIHSPTNTPNISQRTDMVRAGGCQNNGSGTSGTCRGEECGAEAPCAMTVESMTTLKQVRELYGKRNYGVKPRH